MINLPLLQPHLSRLWHSPTFNTFLSFATRTLSLVLVVPLVLRKFTPEDTALWFVFSSVISVQSLASFGFVPSFARMVAYARGGLPVEAMSDLSEVPPAGSMEIHWGSLGRLWKCMTVVFGILAVASLILMAMVGTAALWKPICQAHDLTKVWMCWGVLILGSTIAMWGNIYGVYLQGMEHVALIRRGETMISLATILTGFVVLLFNGGLLALILSNQVWAVAGILLNRYFCTQVDGSSWSRLEPGQWDQAVFRVVWSAAWKNGLTSLFTTGLVQSTTIIQAQFGLAAATATYGFTFRIASLLGQTCQAPFASKLPALARLRAQGRIEEQTALLRRGMGMTHLSIVAAVFGYAVAAPYLLRLIGSRSVVFDPTLWALFALNLFFDRYTGMLQQVRNLTNKPAEHIGMIGYATVFLTILIIALPRVKMYAFPLAMLGAQVLFALWFGGIVAYRTLKVNPLRFERKLAIPAFLAVLGMACWLLLKDHFLK